MNRRELLQLSVLGAAGAATAQEKQKREFEPPPPFDYAGKSIKALQAEMKDGKLTSAQLTQAYIQRIEAVKPWLHAVLEVNPDALPTAEALDKERKEKSAARSPLHGIPVLLKDNIDTGDKMQTTAGSMALLGTPAKNDAFVVKKLREAGAVILGKANMSEWANIRSGQATSGWSARGGQGRNPYALDRSPIGSSSGSGIAVASDLCTVALGTETNGSIIAPSSAMALVGLKPTVGLVSRSGIIPISHTQDTAGPMGRTVEDVAFLLNALVAFDQEDLGMRGARPKAEEDYSKLDKDALKGKRLGVVRALFGKGQQLKKVTEAALKDLEKLGATLVEVELPPADDAAQLEVLLTELKADLADYLKKRRPDAAVKTLADVIAFNQKNAEREMAFFGQDLFEQADKKGPLTGAAYKKALDICKRKAKTEGIDPVMKKNKLDALVTGALDPAWIIDPVLGDPSGPASGCGPAAIAGYPSLTVPMGHVGGLPVGLLFIGAPWSEKQLLSFGHTYEQATSHRSPPTYAATATPKF